MCSAAEDSEGRDQWQNSETITQQYTFFRGFPFHPHTPMATERRELRLDAARILLSTQAAQRDLDAEARSTRRKSLEAALVTAPDDTSRRALLAASEASERAILVEKRKRWTADDFEVLRVIGRGAFGEVSLARARGKLFALTSICTDGGGGAGGADPPLVQHVSHVRAERDALAALNAHPFVISLHYSFQVRVGQL